jgi:hypothetical protein
MPLPGTEPSACFWVGLEEDPPPTPEQEAALAGVAASAAAALGASVSPEERLMTLTRLEQAAELIPALLRVLDVRDVIERLSATAKKALPHHLLLLNLFSEDLSTFTVYARSDQGAGLGMVRPNAYPASTIRAWTFSIIDDHRLHPMERDSPATKIGARSSLRFPVRFDDRVIGGVSFVSFQPHAFLVDGRHGRAAARRTRRFGDFALSSWPDSSPNRRNGPRNCAPSAPTWNCWTSCSPR